MSLADILEGIGFVAGATVFVYGFRKLMREHYIPWTKKTDKELDKHPEYDGCRIDGKEDKQ